MKISESLRRVASKSVTTFLLCLGTIVAIQNVYLCRELNKERNPPREIPLGTTLGIEGQTVEGRPRVLTKSELDHALIISFSPSCHFCEENQGLWNKLADQLHKNGVWHVFWISRDTTDLTRDYCLKWNIPQQDVLSNPPYGTYLQMRMREVPNTLLVEGGAVRKQWVGVLHPADWQQIFSNFGLSAPSIPPRI